MITTFRASFKINTKNGTHTPLSYQFWLPYNLRSLKDYTHSLNLMMNHAS
jgi:HAMP domain-containing protein